LTAIALLAVSVPTPIYVETSSTSTLAFKLRDLLRVELSTEAIVDVPADARLLIYVDVTEATMFVEARDPSGAVLIDRSIALTGGTSPALRVAVLLVREAIDVLPAAAPEPEPEPEPPPEPVLEIKAPGPRLEAVPSISVMSWRSPSSPVPALGLSANLRFDEELRFGISMLVTPCKCERSTRDLSLEATELAFAAEAELALFSTSVFRLHIAAALGLDWINGEARALVFAGDGEALSGSVSELQVFAFSTAVVRIPLDVGLELRFFGGPRFLFPAPSFGITEGFNRDARQNIEAGFIGFFGGAGIAYTIF
jgi:hypothetical protein